jgi:hypothetical protein
LEWRKALAVYTTFQGNRVGEKKLLNPTLKNKIEIEKIETEYSK